MMTRLASLALVALFVVACGGSSGTPPPPTPVPPPTAAPQGTIGATCATMLRPLLNVLEDLNGRLNVGLPKADYGTRVGDVSVEYSKLNPQAVAAVEPNCLVVGQKLEDAFNQYNDANGKWNDCIQQTGCTTKSIQPTLQLAWSKATADISAARAYFPAP